MLKDFSIKSAILSKSFKLNLKYTPLNSIYSVLFIRIAFKILSLIVVVNLIFCVAGST